MYRKVFIWTPLIFFLLLCLFKSFTFPVHDFANYYFGSYFLMQGEFTEEIYQPLVFNELLATHGHVGHWMSYAPNPPFTAILFLPFTILKPFTAKVALILGSILLFILTLYRLAKQLQISPNVMALLPFAVAAPIFYLAFGQVYLVLFVLLAEGYIAWINEKHWVTGLLWGPAILLKITPAILLVFLFVRKEYKTLTAVVLSLVTLLSISIVFTGWEVWHFFITTILPRAGQGEATSASFSINYQSLFMFLKYIFVFDSLENKNAVIDSQLIFHLCLVVAKASVLILAIAHTRRNEHSFESFCIWVLASFLMSPYGSTYGYLLFILPLMTITHDRKRLAALAFITCIITAIPMQFLYDLPMVLQFPKLYLTVAFFAVLISGSKPAMRLSWCIPLVLLAFVSEAGAFFKESSGSQYLLKNANPSLIIDYNVKNGKLEYSHWTPQGVVQAHTEIVVNSILPIRASNNQIIVGNNVITNSSDLKKSPAIINDTSIVYLSDEGRGYGFYTLRQLPYRK
jgi:hypothetical protein